MGPFIFLVKPALAALMIIAKLIATAGYAITNNTHIFSAVPEHGHERGAVMYAVDRRDSGEQAVVVRLPVSREIFTAPVDLSAAAAADPDLIIELTSSRGEKLRCIFEGRRSAPTGGACLTADGEHFKLVL